MCDAFSCVIVRNKKVYWKLGMDSHNNIVKHFNLKDDNIGEICPVEITPKNKDYINPDEWVFRFDEKMPDWWKQSHEKACWAALEVWKQQLSRKIRKRRLKNLVNPFSLPKVTKVTKRHIRLLKKWDSIEGSVRDFVKDSVDASVGDSVRASVYCSVGNYVLASVEYLVRGYVGDSVGNYVWDSVRAYTGSMFRLRRNEWLYTEKIKTKGYPFQPAVDLWEVGLVASFDGRLWRLHSGKKAEVVFSITKNELKKIR